MLNIPETIQALLRADSVRKNFRVQFPNGERADLTNSDIAANSVRFSESVCSRQAFRFGLAEASVIEFETVGVENIRGVTIKCACEVDTSSLTTAQINAIASDPGDGSIVLAGASDIGYGFYRIPYGVFIVDTCPRNQEAQSHRKVTAYSPSYYTVPNPVERAKLECPIPAAGWTYRPKIAPLVLSQLAYQSAKPLIAAGWTPASWSFSGAAKTADGIKVRVKNAAGHDLEIYISAYYKYVGAANGNDENVYAVEFKKNLLRSFISNVNNFLSGLNVQFTTATVAGSVTVPLPDIDTLRFLISRQVQFYNGQKYTGSLTDIPAFDVLQPLSYFYEEQLGDSSTAYSTDKVSIIDFSEGDDGFIAFSPCGATGVPDPFSQNPWGSSAYIVFPYTATIKVDNLTEGTSSSQLFTVNPVWNTFRYAAPQDYPLADVSLTFEANGDQRGVSSFTGQIDFAKVINDYLELCGWVSSPARDGDARLIHLRDAAAMPYSPSDYSKFWLDEESGRAVGTVRYKAKIGDDRVVAEYQFGNGEGVYDMTSNSIFEAIGYTPAQVNDFLQTYFVPHVQDLVLNGIDLEARGLPHLEAGDAIDVSDGSTTVRAFAMLRELRGEQVLFDEIESSGKTDGQSSTPSAVYGSGGGGGSPTAVSVAFEYEGNHGSIYSTWTAPYDGIAIAIAGYNTSGSAGYWYINDTTDNLEVAKLSIRNANGTSQSTSFPIIKGHTYDGTQVVASLASVKLLCYKIVVTQQEDPA